MEPGLSPPPLQWPHHQSVRTIIFVSDFAAVDEEAILKDIVGQFQPPKGLTEEEMRSWRRKGPLGKIHNIVVYIQRSTQRTEAFKALLEANGLGLTRDNATRWNSWFRMLERALKLIEAVKVYCFKNSSALAEDTLWQQEWDDLRKLIKFLEAYSGATQASEGRFATLDIILPTMDFLLETLEAGKAEAETTGDTFLALCCNAGWAKLNKYYTLTERSAAFIAAIVMCPQFKWQYISDMQWPEDWIETARSAVQKMWESEYKGSQVPELPLSSEDITDCSNFEKRELVFTSGKSKSGQPRQYKTSIRNISAVLLSKHKTLGLGGLKLHSVTTSQTLVKWPWICSQFLQCQVRLNGYFLAVKSRLQTGVIKLGLIVEAIECLKSWMRKNSINFVRQGSRRYSLGIGNGVISIIKLLITFR